MKKVVAFLLLTLFLSCKEQLVDNEPVLSQSGILRKQESQMPCGNDYYPSIGDNRIFGIEWCLEPGIKTYSRTNTCIIWSNIITSPSGRILRTDYPCDYDPVFDGPAATQMWLYRPYQPSIQLSWSFVWCDWYVVERKIGNGTWNQIASYNNSTGSGNLSVSDWLSPTSELITYRVITMIDGIETISNEISIYY